MTAWRLLALAAVAAIVVAPARAQDAAQLKRGEYVFNAAGCSGCHTDRKAGGAELAGGRALKTPFGAFYGPNITPHPAAGIGKWSEGDFVRAMREGIGPGGTHFFPVFPYTAFTYMTDADLKDLWAYLRTVPSSDKPSRPHEISFPFNLRVLQIGWRMLNFDKGPFVPDPKASPEVNRGAYLVRAVTHCGECHTPRNAMGGIKTDMWLAGAGDGPEGETAPNITPDNETGIGKWSAKDIAFYLQDGVGPEGDFAGSLMADVIKDSTSKLTDSDRAAIAAYLKALPPIANKVRRSQH